MMTIQRLITRSHTVFKKREGPPVQEIPFNLNKSVKGFQTCDVGIRNIPLITGPVKNNSVAVR